MSDENLRWKTIRERILVDSPVIQFIARETESQQEFQKKHHTFYLMKSRDWCNVIPVTATGKIVLVKQHRLGTDETSIEFPGGVCDLEDQDPLATAIRELKEETGYTPLPGAKSQELGWTHPNPAIQNNRCFNCIVGPVEKTTSPSLDSGELMETLELSVAEVLDLIQSGQMRHSLIINAFLFLFLENQDSRDSLIQRVAGFSSV